MYVALGPPRRGGQGRGQGIFQPHSGAPGMEKGSVWTPPPRACVLGGVQTRTLAAWVAGCANQGRMEFHGVALPVRGGGAGLMGRQGFLR